VDPAGIYAGCIICLVVILLGRGSWGCAGLSLAALHDSHCCLLSWADCAVLHAAILCLVCCGALCRSTDVISLVAWCVGVC
jgi:hypothetical protein